MLKLFRAARRVSTPLVCIKTSDPAATMATIIESFNGSAPAILAWDIARGIHWKNEEGMKAVWVDLLQKPETETLPESETDKAQLAENIGQQTQNPFEAVMIALRLPAKALLFMANIQRALPDNPAVSQALWNLRDVFKLNRRTLVMTCPDVTFPAELGQDVLILDEPLPNPIELARIVKSQYVAAGLVGKTKGKADPVPSISEEDLTKAVDALSGLAAFPAEQATAMSLTPNGVDLNGLWDRKRTMIEATPGLSVNRSGETFDDIGGCENAKNFFRSVLAGAEPPRAVVFLDEIEKSFGAAGSDTSGVSQGFLGTMLSYMQDHACNGCLFVGPPGAAKSAMSKAIGNTAGIPTVVFDINGMKGSLVGASEQSLRNALKVVTAVSQGRTLFVATCNSIAVLPPELRRRFNFSTMFFDLPTKEERSAIWKIYLSKYKTSGNATAIPDEGWTGAEIKQASYLSWNLKCRLEEAATFIVPVARSAADQIEKLRREASGRFISASYPGAYKFESRAVAAKQEATARRIELEE